MNSLKNRRLQRRYTNITIIIGLALFGITLYTTVFANVIWTDKTLPWLEAKLNVRETGVLKVVCDPSDPSDTRAGSVLTGTIHRECPTVNVSNVVGFSSALGGIRTYITATTVIDSLHPTPIVLSLENVYWDCKTGKYLDVSNPDKIARMLLGLRTATKKFHYQLKDRYCTQILELIVQHSAADGVGMDLPILVLLLTMAKARAQKTCHHIILL
jgi:hypothetical protein